MMGSPVMAPSVQDPSSSVASSFSREVRRRPTEQPESSVGRYQCGSIALKEQGHRLLAGAV